MGWKDLLLFLPSAIVIFAPSTTSDHDLYMMYSYCRVWRLPTARALQTLSCPLKTSHHYPFLYSNYNTLEVSWFTISSIEMSAFSIVVPAQWFAFWNILARNNFLNITSFSWFWIQVICSYKVLVVGNVLVIYGSKIIAAKLPTSLVLTVIVAPSSLGILLLISPHQLNEHIFHKLCGNKWTCS